jgi:hypothetical protein
LTTNIGVPIIDPSKRAQHRWAELEKSMKNFNVTFWNMAGESLGTVAVQAATQSKAKILAASLYTCSWVSQTAEAA